MHQDLRWRQAIGNTYEGKLACAKGLDEFLQASKSYRIDLDEVTDLGRDHVLVGLRVEIEGKSSGAAGSASLFSLVTLREGLVAEIAEYPRRADALGSVGMAE